MWSLSSVDFHILTLQLPIQTPNCVAPELQVFVSSLAISARRAHPSGDIYRPRTEYGGRYCFYRRVTLFTGTIGSAAVPSMIPPQIFSETSPDIYTEPFQIFAQNPQIFRQTSPPPGCSQPGITVNTRSVCIHF